MPGRRTTRASRAAPPARRRSSPARRRSAPAKRGRARQAPARTAPARKQASQRTQAPARKRAARAPARRAATPRRSGAHPKMRERRVQVARDAGRRRLRRLVLVVGLAGVVFSIGGLALSPLLDVDRLRIRGAGPRAEEVRAAAEVERGDPILLVDTGATAERIESLAWVERAEVTRELPGTLEIEVIARPPVAHVPRSDGTFAAVDPTGTVVSVEAAPPAGLTSLVSETADPEPGDRIEPRAAARVAAALGPLADRVTRVFVDRGRAALLLHDGAEVRLGRLDRLSEKARAADAVLASLTSPDGAITPIHYLDVRVPSAPVTG